MKANIEVRSRDEASAIKTGLEDPAIRAFVVVMGVLMTLPSDRARKRVLTYVEDRFREEDDLRVEIETNGGSENRSA